MIVTIRLEADWGFPPYYVDEGDGPFELYEVGRLRGAVRPARARHLRARQLGSALPARPQLGRPRQLGFASPADERHFYEQGRVVSRLLRRHVPAEVRIKYVGDGNIPAEYY